MRTAIVSDIHGNVTALEAVIASLKESAPDLVLHGGDLGDGGSNPAAVVDRIRELGWPGVKGNTDEMLARPCSLGEHLAAPAAPQSLIDAIAEIAAAAREALGEARLAWLDGLPESLHYDHLALLHASPGSLWQAPGADAADGELEAAYAGLGRELVVYGHIHRPFVRELAGLRVANTGSVSFPHDGDPRAAYLLMDGAEVSIRRVEYDIDREAAAVAAAGVPHAGWIARLLERGRFELP